MARRVPVAPGGGGGSGWLDRHSAGVNNKVNSTEEPQMADEKHGHLSGPSHSGADFRAGDSVIIRTVTMYHIGRVKRQTKDFLVLVDAAWVVDTGRFATALLTGQLAEVEHIPGELRVHKAAVVDVCEWNHPLPYQKPTTTKHHKHVT